MYLLILVLRGNAPRNGYVLPSRGMWLGDLSRLVTGEDANQVTWTQISNTKARGQRPVILRKALNPPYHVP